MAPRLLAPPPPPLYVSISERWFILIALRSSPKMALTRIIDSKSTFHTQFNDGVRFFPINSHYRVIFEQFRKCMNLREMRRCYQQIQF